MKKHLLFIATFIATLFPFWAANAQTSVSVTPVSANYTAATPTVTVEVSWPAGSRNANERAKVWLFVDYRRVQNNAYAGGWLRAGITDPPVLCTAGTPTLAPGNDKGFWLQGPADNSAFAATVTVQVNVDVTGYDPKFGWCAYATDLPPYAEAVPGGYNLRGTEPFIIQTHPTDAGSTVTQSATTFHGCMYGLTDATGCPGELPPMPAITGFTASATTVCAGQSATLTATAAGAELYSFDDGANWVSSPSTVVSPTATTTYILKVSRAAGGCTVTSPNTVTVTVLPAPTGLSLTATPAAVCAGQSSTLTASAAGAAAYSLNGTDWQSANTFNVTPTATTNYTLYVRSAAGCTASLANAAAVTVNSLPAGLSLAASPAAVCAGQSATLTASAAGAAAYSLNGADWQSANTFNVTPTVTTNYTLYVRSAAGCTASLANAAAVTVNSLPAGLSLAASPSAVCAGQSSTLTASAAGAAAYSLDGATWQPANTFNVTTTATTNYTLYVRSAAGCTATLANAAAVTLYPLPTIATTNPAPRCGAGAVTLTATASGGTTTAMTYTWTVGGGAAQTTTTNSYAVASAPVGSTAYSVTVTNANGCISTAATGNITVHPLPALSNPNSPSRCGAGAVTLAATASGGTTTAMTYTWTVGGGAAQTTTTNSYAVASAPVGSTTYSVTVTNANGCISTAATGNITVHPLPALSNPNSPSRCGAGAVTLTATASGGTTTAMTYTWTVGGATYTTTTNSYAVASAPVGSTAYSVTVTNANGCISAAATGNITVNSLPATPTNPVPATRCGAGNVTIGATTPGGVSVDWYSAASGGTPFATDAATITVSATNTASYYAQARNTSTGCVSAARLEVTVTINTAVAQATISGNSSNTCPANTVTLTATASGATSYTWYKDGTQVQTGTSNAYTVSVAGDYTVKGYNAHCTGVTSSAKGVTITCCNCVPGCGSLKVAQITNSSDGFGTWNSMKTKCASMSGRMPTASELTCMCQNKNTLPGGMNTNDFYWSSTVAVDANYDYTQVSGNTCMNRGEYANMTYLVRCVL